MNGSVSFKVEVAIVAAILGGALALQLWLIETGRVFLDVDECTLALMGLDVRRGARPIFFLGQNYMGCAEAYLYAVWSLLSPWRTTLSVKMMGAMMGLAYLLACYFFVRRFMGKPGALLTLALMALPPQLLAIWLPRVRGYMPWLIAGPLVLYQLTLIVEECATERMWRHFARLGFVLGVAWWLNPLSMYYIATAGIIGVASRGGRHALLAMNPSISRSDRALQVLTPLSALALLSRSLFPERNFPWMLWVFDHRSSIVATAIVVMSACGAMAFRRNKEHQSLAFLALFFVVGNAPQVYGHWTVRELNLKQDFAPLSTVLAYINSLPFTVWPSFSGAADIITGEALIPSALIGVLAAIHLLMAYQVLRRGVWRWPAMRVAWLMGCVALALYFTQPAMALREHRYLLCLFLPLSMGLASLLLELEGALRGAGIAALALLLGINLCGVAALRPREVLRPSGDLPDERALVEYFRARRIPAVYCGGEDEMAPRMTYFAEESPVCMNPAGLFNRNTRYTDLFLRQRAFGVVMPNESRKIDWIGRPPDAVIGSFALFEGIAPGPIRAKYPHADGLPGD